MYCSASSLKTVQMSTRGRLRTLHSGMTHQEIFSQTICKSARSGIFDRTDLISQVANVSKELRDGGSTPEGAVRFVKETMESNVLSPTSKMKEEIVTRCIEAFFEV